MCRFCVRQDSAGEFTRREVLKVAGAGMTAGLLTPTILTAAQQTAAKTTPGDPLDVRSE